MGNELLDRIFDMQELTGGQIRKEYLIIQEALKQIPINEKFLKETDPSIVIADVMEQIDKSLGTIRTWYNKKARNRNEIVKPVQKELQEIISYASQAIKDLNNSEPEDINRKVEY